MRTVQIVTSLFILAGSALADPQPWMVQEKSDSLGVIMQVGDFCAGEPKEYADIVNGILIRSRLRGTNDYTDLYLKANVQCGSGTVLDGVSTFVVTVHFGRRAPDGSVMLYDGNYGTYGIASNEAVRDGLRSAVEAAVTDYLQANFDL